MRRVQAQLALAFPSADEVKEITSSNIGYAILFRGVASRETMEDPEPVSVDAPFATELQKGALCP